MTQQTIETYTNGVLVSTETITVTTNPTTIRTNILARKAEIQTWIKAHPTGGTLTGAQTLVLAKMLNGLANLLLNIYTTTETT